MSHPVASEARAESAPTAAAQVAASGSAAPPRADARPCALKDRTTGRQGRSGDREDRTTVRQGGLGDRRGHISVRRGRAGYPEDCPDRPPAGHRIARTPAGRPGRPHGGPEGWDRCHPGGALYRGPRGDRGRKSRGRRRPRGRGTTGGHDRAAEGGVAGVVAHDAGLRLDDPAAEPHAHRGSSAGRCGRRSRDARPFRARARAASRRNPQGQGRVPALPRSSRARPPRRQHHGQGRRRRAQALRRARRRRAMAARPTSPFSTSRSRGTDCTSSASRSARGSITTPAHGMATQADTVLRRAGDGPHRSMKRAPHVGPGRRGPVQLNRNRLLRLRDSMTATATPPSTPPLNPIRSTHSRSRPPEDRRAQADRHGEPGLVPEPAGDAAPQPGSAPAGPEHGVHLATRDHAVPAEPARHGQEHQGSRVRSRSRSSAWQASRRRHCSSERT